jgi:hypothetical protein
MLQAEYHSSRKTITDLFGIEMDEIPPGSLQALQHLSLGGSLAALGLCNCSLQSLGLYSLLITEPLHAYQDTHMAVERPELIRVVNNVERSLSPDVAYAYHILYTFAHVFHMRQRKVLSDNEWTGWLRWMKALFDMAP